MVAATTSTIDNRQSLQLLRAIFHPNDLIEVRPIESWCDGPRKRSRILGQRWARLSEIETVFPWLETLNQSQHANAFFGVCPRTRNGGTKKDVACVRAAWCDIDHCRPDEVLFRSDEVNLPRPSIVIDSGHGVHVYWVFNTVFVLSDDGAVAKAEGILQRLSVVLGGDHTQDVCRVLRLPGFPNVKDARNGTPSVPCRIVEINPMPVLEDLDELAEYLPDVAHSTPSGATTAKASDQEPTSEGDELTRRARQRLGDKVITDRSKVDFQFLADAIRDGYQKEEVWRAVGGLSKFAERGRSYFDLTWKKASAAISANRPLTDLGNAERLADRHGHELRYGHETGQWLVWSGKRWEIDQKGTVMAKAALTARSIYQEAAKCPDPDRARLVGQWAGKSESRHRLEAMIALAKSQRAIAIKSEQLDSEYWLFNVLNGTIDLRTGQLRPHDPADLITKIANTDFRPGAPCPRWHAFLDRVFNCDLALIQFVQRWCGMSLTGDIREQLLVIFYGQGNNGKNVLLDTVCGIMGDYASTAPPELLTVSKQREHPTEIADLWGRRLVIASETEEGASLRLQLIKRLTGDARLKGRFMRQDFFEFPRTHKLILVTNNRPKVSENTEAAWRRIRLIPFNVVVPPEERDPTLIDKLRVEWPGILAWMVQGCLDWQREGLGQPSAVSEATASYRQEEDILAEFLADYCVMSPNSLVSRIGIHRAYQIWTQGTAERQILDRTRLYERLRRLDGVVDAYVMAEGRSVRGFVGIELKSGSPVTGKEDL